MDTFFLNTVIYFVCVYMRVCVCACVRACVCVCARVASGGDERGEENLGKWKCSGGKCLAKFYTYDYAHTVTSACDRQHRDSRTLHRDSSTQHRYSSTLHRDSSTQHRDSSTLHRDSSTQHRDSSTLHRALLWSVLCERKLCLTDDRTVHPVLYGGSS